MTDRSLRAVSKWRDGSLRSRLMTFFNANPGEELTAHQISEKFSVAPVTVKEAVGLLEKGDFIERVKVIRLKTRARS